MSKLRTPLGVAAIITIVVATILSLRQELGEYEFTHPDQEAAIKLSQVVHTKPELERASRNETVRKRDNKGLVDRVGAPTVEQNLATALTWPFVEQTPNNANSHVAENSEPDTDERGQPDGETLQLDYDRATLPEVESDSDSMTGRPKAQEQPEIWLYWPSAIGRFGKQLWNYASYIGMYLDLVDKLNGTRTVKLFRSKEAGRDFEGLFESGLPPVVDAISSVFALQKESGYGNFEPFDMAKNVCIATNYSGTMACLISRGYSFLQSFKYFRNHEREVREALTWSSDYWNGRPKELWDEFLEEHKEFEEGEVTVGVHVRRGDLLTLDVQYMRIPSQRFYESGIAYFRNKYNTSNVQFLVASEDKDWCRGAFRENPNVHILPNEARPEDDMAILTRKSDHFIMGVGTYGWWSAWLAGGDVVYYGDALDMEHDMNKGKVTLADYYPSDWVAIGDADLFSEVWIVIEDELVSSTKESEVFGMGQLFWLVASALGVSHHIRSTHPWNVQIYTPNKPNASSTELSSYLSSPTFRQLNVTTKPNFSISARQIDHIHHRGFDLSSNCTFHSNLSTVPVCIVSLDASMVPSYRHFINVETEVRSTLKVRDDVQERVESFWLSKGWHNLSIDLEAPVFVGMEITNHTKSSQKYYRLAMVRIIDLYPTAVFIAACDDERLCSEVLVNPTEIDAMSVHVLPEEMTKIERWTLLATKCQHSILNMDHRVGVGLDWWSAWWTNGTVVYLKPPIAVYDYYPSQWIALDRSELFGAKTDQIPTENRKGAKQLVSTSLQDGEQAENGEPEIWLHWTAPVSSARFGNRLWTYASYLGIYFDATKKYNGTRIIHLVRSEKTGTQLEGIFGQPLPPVVQPLAKVSNVREHGYGIFEPFDLSQYSCQPANYSGKMACLVSRGVSYLQSFRYFQNNSDLVREALAWNQDFLNKRPNELWGELCETHQSLVEAEVVVGIHIRRGDLMKDTYLKTPLLSFYEAGISYFNTKHNASQVHFLVASDDKAWCRQAFDKHPSVHVLPHGAEPEVDMAILSTKSNHFIMGVGTYGWWAAWLTGGEVVYYKDAIAMEDRENKGKVRLEDYYPEEWVALGDDDLPPEPEMWIIMKDSRRMERQQNVLLARQLWFYASALGEFFRYRKIHRGPVRLFQMPSRYSVLPSILSTPPPEILDADIKSGFSIQEHLDSAFPDLEMRSCNYQVNLSTAPVCVADFDALSTPPSHRYFSGAESELRTAFQLRGELKDRSERFWVSKGLHNLTTPEGEIPVFVGMQVSNNSSLAHQYYRIATKRAKRMHPRSVFVAACDDLSWCLDNLEVLSVEAPVHVLQDGLNALEKWAILSLKCQHMVLSVDHRLGRDMGWWSAWWTSGNVFYLESDDAESGYFPPKWVGLKEKDVKASTKARG